MKRVPGLSGDVFLFISPFIMTEWSPGCWSPSQDWPNTRWTSGWPETCSSQPTSGSRTDLLETGFPLYLVHKIHIINTHIGVDTLQCLLAGGDVPWWGHSVPGGLASRLRVWDGSRDIWERLMSADSCSRLWKLFLQWEDRRSVKILGWNNKQEMYRKTFYNVSNVRETQSKHFLSYNYYYNN